MRLNTGIIFIYKRRNLDPLFKTSQNQEVHLELSDFKAHSFNYFQFNFDFWFSKDKPPSQVSQEPCPESPRSLFSLSQPHPHKDNLTKDSHQDHLPALGFLP